MEQINKTCILLPPLSNVGCVLVSATISQALRICKFPNWIQKFANLKFHFQEKTVKKPIKKGFLEIYDPIWKIPKSAKNLKNPFKKICNLNLCLVVN